LPDIHAGYVISKPQGCGCLGALGGVFAMQKLRVQKSTGRGFLNTVLSKQCPF
jgi:hypothetical protein